jgi:hypothetical protein
MRQEQWPSLSHTIYFSRLRICVRYSGKYSRIFRTRSSDQRSKTSYTGSIGSAANCRNCKTKMHRVFFAR